jgi:hypothetical protein
MQKAVFGLFDLLYGELDVEEDRIRGRVVYRFISYEDFYLREPVQQNPKGGRRTKGSSYTIIEFF